MGDEAGDAGERYECRVDQEDLTAQVLAARNSTAVQVIREIRMDVLDTPGFPGHSWKVVVTCSQGHENTFKGYSWG